MSVSCESGKTFLSVIYVEFFKYSEHADTCTNQHSDLLALFALNKYLFGARNSTEKYATKRLFLNNCSFSRRDKWNLSLMSRCTPVSYTHLDVYKRQKLIIGKIN